MNTKLTHILRRGLQAAKLTLKMCIHVTQNPSLFVTNIQQYFNKHVTPHNDFHHTITLPSVAPLNLSIDSSLSSKSTLNVLIPGMAMRAMSGGPNTAINIAYRMAASGIAVRFISTDIGMDKDHEPLWDHFTSLTGIKERLANVEIACGFDRSKPLPIGENDVFLGTAWWTVQMIKYALPLTKPKKFIYIIQEFEPGLYSWSTQYALSLETYGMNFRAFINEELLADFLCEQKVGRFADPSFIKQCAVFEPALDATKFYPEKNNSPERPKQLLFYARPSKAQRNLFELGIYALQQAVNKGVFSKDKWEMYFIGEDIPDIKLSDNVTITCKPWLTFDEYAKMMRSADVLLSLMLSPHTSYPPLEIAACGGIAVTNTLADKTTERLSNISQNIIGVLPTVEGIAEGLECAISRIHADNQSFEGVNMPSSWEESFSKAIPKGLDMFNDCLKSVD